MSTLAENVAKVTAAHAALKTAIAAKGVTVPDGTKLSEMPALVGQIKTQPAMSDGRRFYAYSVKKSIDVPAVVFVDFAAATDLSYCFEGCSALTSLTLPDGFGQNATGLASCFKSCSALTSLTLPAGFGQNATGLASCFRSCSALTSLTLPAGFGQNATTCSYCFADCSALTSLTLPAGFGQNATSFARCFRSCSALTSLTLPAGFGQNATGFSLGFDGCSALTTITGNPNFNCSVSFSDSENLTHDSLMVVINGLQTVTTTKTLTLGSTNKAKLSEEEIAVATAKGWTIA